MERRIRSASFLEREKSRRLEEEDDGVSLTRWTQQSRKRVEGLGWRWNRARGREALGHGLLGLAHEREWGGSKELAPTAWAYGGRMRVGFGRGESRPSCWRTRGGETGHPGPIGRKPVRGEKPLSFSFLIFLNRFQRNFEFSLVMESNHSIQK